MKIGSAFKKGGFLYGKDTIPKKKNKTVRVEGGYISEEDLALVLKSIENEKRDKFLKECNESEDNE